MHASGLSGRHKDLNEKGLSLALIMLLFPLMLFAVLKVISYRKTRCHKTPNSQLNNSLITTQHGIFFNDIFALYAFYYIQKVFALSS